MKKLLFTSVFLFLSFFVLSQNQKKDTLLYLPVKSNQGATLNDIFKFHESDFLLAKTVNPGDTNIITLEFYNDVNTSFDAYVWYILKSGTLIKSRLIKIKK